MFKSFFFSLSPLQCSLHPKHTAKRFTSSTEEEKLFLALIAVVSTEHPAYPAHKVQNLILLGCTTNTSAIKQTETAHLICYHLTTKVSLLNLSLFFATKKKGHWAFSCINGHRLVIYISCERWGSHGVHFDSMVPKCFPSCAFHSIIQKALRWRSAGRRGAFCFLLHTSTSSFSFFFVQGWLGIMSFQMDKIKWNPALDFWCSALCFVLTLRICFCVVCGWGFFPHPLPEMAQEMLNRVLNDFQCFLLTF